VQTFEQLLVPAQTVACDIESGERICLGEGRLDAAFRASSSVPMIWAPVRRDGRTLVDGSMVDPVPAEVVREMGADLCIAVNVVPQLQKGVTTALQRVYQRVNTFNPLSYTSGSRDMPNMFDLVMNSIQSLQYELGNFKAISADVRINVELAEFTWIDFHRALELIARGAEAATGALPDIERMLSERLPQPI
jgi:NTE family protein